MRRLLVTQKFKCRSETVVSVRTYMYLVASNTHVGYACQTRAADERSDVAAGLRGRRTREALGSHQSARSENGCSEPEGDGKFHFGVYG